MITGEGNNTKLILQLFSNLYFFFFSLFLKFSIIIQIKEYEQLISLV